LFRETTQSFKDIPSVLQDLQISFVFSSALTSETKSPCRFYVKFGGKSLNISPRSAFVIASVC